MKTYNLLTALLLIFVITACGAKEEPLPPISSEVPSKETEVIETEPQINGTSELGTTVIFLEFLENKENQIDSIIEINNNGSKSAINVNTELFLHTTTLPYDPSCTDCFLLSATNLALSVLSAIL